MKKYGKVKFMQKKEILYISDTCNQSDWFLRDLAESLNKLEINFKLNRQNLSIETEGYKVIGISSNSYGLEKRGYLAKYFIKGSNASEEDFHRMIRFKLKENVKEIESISYLIELLSGKIYEKCEKER